MMKGNSSEESDDRKRDNESGYEASESSDGDGDDDDVSLVNKATKTSERNSGISIREPTDSSILVSSPSNKRKRDTVRLPAQRFKDPIVGSSSSSSSAAASNVSVEEISSEAQVNVNGGTITTTSSESWSIPVAVPTRQDEIDAITRSNLEDSIFGSSSGSNNTRPNFLLLGSSSSSPSVQAQAQANITRSSSSSQPLLFPALPNYQQQYQLPPLPSSVVPQQPYLRRMAPHATAMQRTYDLRQQRQLLPIPYRIPIGIPFVPGDEMDAIKRYWSSLVTNPSSNLHGPNFVPGKFSTFQGNITRPSTVNPHRSNSVSGPLPLATLSDILGSSSSSVQPQTNLISRSTSALFPAIPNYQQQHPSSSSSMDVRGLDRNYQNNEDGGEENDEEEDEGLDLNLRLGMNDEPKSKRA